MEKNFDIKQLLQKPIAMMTGEELTFLIGSSMEAKRSETTPIVQKRTYYGIEGIAQVFGCSVPTANCIKRSGIIDAAITQIGRKIIVDADMALSLDLFVTITSYDDMVQSKGYSYAHEHFENSKPKEKPLIQTTKRKWGHF